MNGIVVVLIWAICLVGPFLVGRLGARFDREIPWWGRVGICLALVLLLVAWRGRA